jgi:TPR repeat protein
MLGAMYYDGRGVPKDFQQALRWFSLAANQGDALTQLRLGLMLSGAQLRDAIAEQMTSAQIAEAQKLAREWNPQPR